MKSNNSLFIIVCLCITIGMMGVYATFIGHFNGKKEYEMRLTAKQQEIEQERFQKSLLTYQLKDFQQSVAQLMPDEKQLTAKYDLKTFSSSLRAPASETALDLSGVIFEKGKGFFNNHQYDRAIKEFNGLLEKYPLSRYSVESQFFVAESYFLKKDFRNSLERIDEMVTQYPGHDLTGFILLRMGQISEMNNQADEATEIYNTVLKNFKNETLKKQAAQLAKGTSLE